MKLALEEHVNFVLIVGDLYDGDWQDFSTGLFFISQMVRLREAKIPVFLIAGNHDAANRMTRSLKLPDNVDLLPSDRPGTRALNGLGVTIHGQGFLTAAVWEDLSAGYPHAVRGDYNIGLLHTCGVGCDGHERYAPCTVEGLRLKGYDYWALGHIHQRQELHREGERPIIFPGNVQGRHARETGPKGCILATVKDGRGTSVEFRRLDVMCWEKCEIDASEMDSCDDALDRASERLTQLQQESDGRLLAVRIVFHGPTTVHEQLQCDPHRWTHELRTRAMQVGGDRIWLEKVEFQTTTRTANGRTHSDGPIEELQAIFDVYRQDLGQLRELGKCLADLNAKLPVELRQGPDALDLNDPVCLLSVLDRARSILVGRLLSGEASS